MKHFKLDTQSNFEEKKLCLAIGNFDGFHKGHQAIIKQLKDISLKNNLSSAIMSFNPHPRTFFNNSNENFNIYTDEEKLIYLKKFNIDIYIDFEFNLNLSQLTPQEFIKNILVDKLNITNLVVGSEFRFGKDRKGNVNILNNLSKKNNYNVHLVDSIMLKDMSSKYSSSIIRNKITEGKIEDVTSSLGRQWYMKGIVIEGQKKAREIWFLCKQYSAKEAFEMGMVNKVVPLGRLEETVLEWCSIMQKRSPLALRMIKRSLNAELDGQHGLMQLAGDATLLYYLTEEAQEGKEAFLEKRAPNFKKYPKFP